jgi:hypothetical protein
MTEVTLTLSNAAVVAAVDAIVNASFRYDFTACRNLETLVDECGGGCADDMAFLRAARDAGVDVGARVEIYQARYANDPDA